MKYRQQQVTLVFFGDGATSQGDFHEGLNFAGVFNTPTVFLCQNSQWAISVPRWKQSKSPTLAPRAHTRTPARTRRLSEPPEAGMTYTHTDKLLYPEAGITKGDVLDFYQRIATRLLPHLRDRPATLERRPEGMDGAAAPHFWQKHTPDYYPAWIERVALPSERGKEVQYVLVNDEATLLYLVNQGTLTFHVGFARLADLDWPDFVPFDLDPGQAGFADAVAVAKVLHRILQAEGHKAFVKTSGKTGLHVLTPWEREAEYDEARAWALGMAQRVVEVLPDQATTERRGESWGGAMSTISSCIFSWRTSESGAGGNGARVPCV